MLHLALYMTLLSGLSSSPALGILKLQQFDSITRNPELRIAGKQLQFPLLRMSKIPGDDKPARIIPRKHSLKSQWYDYQLKLFLEAEAKKIKAAEKRRLQML